MTPVSTRLYVGGLPLHTDRSSLRDFFSGSGTVRSVQIVSDLYTGRPKGFGFIEMETEEEAQTAITLLNGVTLDDQLIRVVKASAAPSTAG